MHSTIFNIYLTFVFVVKSKRKGFVSIILIRFLCHLFNYIAFDIVFYKNYLP